MKEVGKRRAKSLPVHRCFSGPLFICMILASALRGTKSCQNKRQGQLAEDQRTPHSKSMENKVPPLKEEHDSEEERKGPASEDVDRRDLDVNRA